MAATPRSDEDNFVTEVIGTLVAAELIKDRDTIQIGIGTVAAAMAAFLGEKQDLGIQTEIITGGVADLVRNKAWSPASTRPGTRARWLPASRLSRRMNWP